MLGRPRDGKEVKKSYSLRVEPKLKEKICKKYGSLQKFFDGVVNGDIHPFHNHITLKVKNE